MRATMRAIMAQSWSGWLLCTLIVGAAVMLNWPVEYESYASRVVGNVANRHQAQIEINELTKPVTLVLGGWPFNWYIANHYQDSTPAIHSSWLRLGANVALFSFATVFFWFYEQRARHNSAELNSNKRAFKRRFSLGDLVLVVTIFGLGMGYWQGLVRIASQQSKSLEERARDQMSGTLTGQLPAWLSVQTSYFNSPVFLRVSELELDKPDNDLLKYALSFNTIRSLRIGGGTYDLKLLDGLRKLPLLTDLRISGRELSPEAIAAIGSCKQLQSLNLMRTNITAEGVHALGEMPKLQVLNLVHTDVSLSKLGHPPLAEKLSVLMLPHSERGQSEELVLEDWKQLTTLQVFEYDAPAGMRPVKIALRRLPKLTKLTLDQFQVFDLTLDEIPQLRSIETLALQAEDRARKQDIGGGIVSLSSLTVKDSTIAKTLELNALVLQTVDIQSNEPIALHFNANSTVATAQELNPRAQHYQKLLDQFGNCSGPISLDFKGLDLRDVDFTQFAKLKGDTTLKMFYPQHTEFISFLAQMRLRELELWGGQLPGQIADIVRAIPTLERLTIPRTPFDFIALEKHQLQEIRFDKQMGRVNNQLTVLTSNRPRPAVAHCFAHLVDLPNLRAEASFFTPLSRVRIENVPALTQLRILQQLPPGSVIRGLRELKCFAAGGKELNDEHFDAIIACNNLETLCLLYSSVSSDRLKEIGKLEQLKCLSLNGSQVSDEALSSWTNLKELRTLRLKQTKITAASLRLIPKLFPKLERLSIDTPIDEATLDEILKCGYLMDFGLIGSQLSDSAVKKILALPALVQLDLSKCKIEQASIDLLKQAMSGRAKKLILWETQQDRFDADSNVPRFRVINEAAPYSQFSVGMEGVQEVWLDQDEIWDEMFIEKTGK